MGDTVRQPKRSSKNTSGMKGGRIRRVTFLQPLRIPGFGVKPRLELRAEKVKLEKLSNGNLLVEGKVEIPAGAFMVEYEG